MALLSRIFPFIEWLKNYNLSKLRADAVAGVSVALVLVPQSMAYAQLAGLPVYYGLYASFLPPMLASLFGSSRQLATGPVAVVSLMTAASLEPLATAGSEAFIAYAILLALAVGIFQFLLGVFKLGVVVNFLSHPVVNGFTNGAALIIATSQLSKLFGVFVENSEHHYETVFNVCKAAVAYTHWPTLVMGLLAFAIMYGLKYFNPRLPFVLVAVVITTVLSWAIGFEKNLTVPLTAVQSPKFRNLVANFNQMTSQIDELARKRTELTPKLVDLKKKLGPRHLETIELEHQNRMISEQIETLKEEVQAVRTGLRNFLFWVVPEKDGSLRFYVPHDFPTGLETDKRNWRLKVGNRSLPENKLVFMGGGEVVGNIPGGLPSFKWPKFDLGVMSQLLSYAVIISLLGFMEAISIAKAMAAKSGQRLDPNQELIGQAISNILGSISQGYPVSGSFSRSAVNFQSGAVTGFSSVVTSLAVGGVLLFLTPLLYHLPQAALAAIIMVAVIGLLNVSGVVHAWRAQPYDGVISVISFLATLAFAPHLDKGITIGVVLSLGVFLYKSMKPKTAVMSMHPDCSYRDAHHHGLKECQHVALIRFDGPLFFANASYLEEQITDRMKSMPALKHLILAANGINDIDASGEETLSLLVDRVRSAGLDFFLSGLKENVVEVLQRTYLWEKIGADHMFPTMAMAVAATHGPAHQGSGETECPLLDVCYLK